MIILRHVGPLVAVILSSWQFNRVLAQEQDADTPASNLTVDVGYGSYTGVYNQTTKLNVWKGYVPVCGLMCYFS